MPEEALMNAIKCLPVLEELDIEPTEEEVKEALGSPSSGKEQLKECTSERDLMVNSSALPDGKPRPRFVRSAYATSFAPMMQQQPHTLRIKRNNT